MAAGTSVKRHLFPSSLRSPGYASHEGSAHAQYDIQAITDSGLNITQALIETDGDAARDTFHVTDALQKVWSQIEARLAGFTGPIFYTGHSLGAALATLAAARAVIEGKLPRPAALYTFGSPRVGDATFTTTLRGVYHCRVVNDNDIVATIPPPLFFRHHGELHHIRHDGRIEVHPRDADVLMTLRRSSIIERTAAALNGVFGGLRACAPLV